MKDSLNVNDCLNCSLVLKDCLRETKCATAYCTVSNHTQYKHSKVDKFEWNFANIATFRIMGMVLGKLSQLKGGNNWTRSKLEITDF